MILTFSYSSTANAALSATTAKTIKGTEPKFKAVSGENRLGFTVNGKFYSESSSDTATTGNIVSGTSKTFDKDLTFNEFAVKTLTFADFTVANDYDDSDGDVAHSTTPFTTGGTTYKWSDNNGTPITGDDLSKMIGCGSGYSMPLKLEITLSGVQVHSEYGDPRDSVLTNLTKTYQIETESAICYAKPNAMIVQPTVTWLGWNGTGWVVNDGSSSSSASFGGGYSSDFDPKWGFKASASPDKFPTTGFPGAKFQLVMTGAQTDWIYKAEVNGVPQPATGGVVEVDSNGNVTLNSKPTGKVKITATLNLNTSITHDYEFNPTSVWALPMSGTYRWDTNAAQNQCSGANNILTRIELTNSPLNSAAPGSVLNTVFNYYTRAIGGGVNNEWGWLEGGIGKTYPDSKWVVGFYWTQDVHTSGSQQFQVYSSLGRVYSQYTSHSNSVACRG